MMIVLVHIVLKFMSCVCVEIVGMCHFCYGILLEISFMFLCVWMLMGVKASLTLGREEMPWVKGLVGFNIEFERFSSWRGFCCSWSMGSLKPYALFVIMRCISVLMWWEGCILIALKTGHLYHGRYKCIDVIRRMYLIALKRHYAIVNVCVYGYVIVLLVKPTFTHCFIITMVNHCVKPWNGVYMCCNDMLYAFLVLECNMFEPCFPSLMGRFLEA